MRRGGRLLGPDSQDWLDALDGLTHDTYHLPGYVMTAAEAAGGGEPMAFYYRDDDGCLLVPLVVRSVPDTPWRDAVSPYGYGGPASDAPGSRRAFWGRAVAALVDTLADRGIVTAFVRVHPLMDTPEEPLARAGRLVVHGQTVSVDLSASLEEIWSGTRRDHRNQINRARRDGLHVTWDEWHHLDLWTQVYHENMRLVDASAGYFFAREYFTALRARLGPHVHLGLAWQGEDLLSGQLVFETSGFVQTHLTGTRPDRRRLHADKLLYDECRRWAKARGNSVQHLGGGFGGADDSLFAYKAGFSDRRHVFRTWRLVLDQRGYEELVARAGAELDPDGFFPAYRAPARELSAR